jgi:ABC-2 type transport system ATP-binding protein
LLAEIELVCDRMAIISRGHVVRAGRLEELRQAGDEIEIVARGVTKELFPDTRSSDGGLRIRIAASLQRATLERVWAAGGEVISVNPVRQSLEDIFLTLTRPDATNKENS